LWCGGGGGGGGGDGGDGGVGGGGMMLNSMFVDELPTSTRHEVCYIIFLISFTALNYR